MEDELTFQYGDRIRYITSWQLTNFSDKLSHITRLTLHLLSSFVHEITK